MNFTLEYKVVNQILDGVYVKDVQISPTSSAGPVEVVGPIYCTFNKYLPKNLAEKDDFERSVNSGLLADWISEGYIKLVYVNSETSEEIDKSDFERGIHTYKDIPKDIPKDATIKEEVVSISKKETLEKYNVSQDKKREDTDISVLDFLQFNKVSKDEFEKILSTSLNRAIVYKEQKVMTYEIFKALPYQEKINTIKKFTKTEFDLLVQIVQTENSAVIKKSAAKRLGEI